MSTSTAPGFIVASWAREMSFGADAPGMSTAPMTKSASLIASASELIVKVKEPQPEKTARLAPVHTLFTYLHLAPDPLQAAGSGPTPFRRNGAI